MYVVSSVNKSVIESCYQADTNIFNCLFCSFADSNRLIFQQHLATHGERPYKCLECNKGFTQKKNLQYHEMIHRGLKPFTCDMCNQGFRNSSCLKLHKKKHHYWK